MENLQNTPRIQLYCFHRTNKFIIPPVDRSMRMIGFDLIRMQTQCIHSQFKASHSHHRTQSIVIKSLNYWPGNMLRPMANPMRSSNTYYPSYLKNYSCKIRKTLPFNINSFSSAKKYITHQRKNGQ